MEQVPDLVNQLKDNLKVQNIVIDMLAGFLKDEGKDLGHTAIPKKIDEMLERRVVPERCNKVFESCECNGKDSEKIKPIFHFTITYKSSPGWRTEAYQYGLLGLLTHFALRTFEPDGKIYDTYMIGDSEFYEWLGLLPGLEKEEDAQIKMDESIDNSKESRLAVKRFEDFKDSPKGIEIRKKALGKDIVDMRRITDEINQYLDSISKENEA